MIRRDTIKKAGATFAQLALSVTALSGGAHSYYRTQRGFYSPGKEMIAELNANPLSATAIQNGDWQKSLGPADNENRNRLELKKTQKARELIIVDGAVQDKHVIFKQARPGVDIVKVEAGKDGMVELMKILSNFTNLDAVHIVSHAESGAIHLGGQIIDQKVLEEDLAGFVAINRAIREGGDLILYGCDLARGEEGNDFLEVIKNNTHVDVAASDDPTGNEAYGGNWDLEIRKGDIETAPLPESIAMKDFTGTLQPHGIATFGSLTVEEYVDDPSIDWGDFTTHTETPGTYAEIISAGTNTICSGSDGLYVNMYNTGSRFYIRSNPDGENFGVTGLSIFADSNSNPADEVSIYGYQDGNPTAVGERLNVPISDTESAIDLTSGVTGSFANITRLRVEAENLDLSPTTVGARDFCLAQVDFVPLDNDGDLTPAAGVSEPVGIDTTIDTDGEAVDIFDFILSDGGGGDLESLSVSQVVANVSGTATSAERGQITWRLDGPDAADVTGNYNPTLDTITFSGLGISVPHGGDETYTINAYFNDNSNLTEGNTVVLSIDGDTDLTTGPGGTQMGITLPVTNGSGTTIDAVATQLVFTTQPSGSTSGSALSTPPVVAATDDFGNTDVDFTETITLTEASAGTLSNTTEAAVNGAAAFTGLTYTATADQEPFTLTASGGGLPAEDSNPVTSDVVATQLQFTQQPAPTTIPEGVLTDFTTDPAVSAVDADNTVDTGYSTDITLAEVNGAGSATMSATGDTDVDGTTVTIVPSSGVSDFPDLDIFYAPVTVGATETFNLRASSGALTTADSDLLTASTSNQAPTVTTAAETSVGATSAMLGGNVTDNSGDIVTDHGIVWGTSTDPDMTNDNVVSIGSGTGSFSQSVGLLPFGTTIHVRAFATNSAGTAYGADESFTTSSAVTVDLTGSEGWRMLSVPDDVNLSTFLDPIWTQGGPGADYNSGDPNVFTWSLSATNSDPSGWEEVTDLSTTTLSAGQGVLGYVFEDPDFDGTQPTGLGDQELTVTGSEHPAPVSSPPMNSNTAGWTLLGNPFASAITFPELSPTNLTDIIYVWDPNDNGGDGGQAGQPSGSWKTWNGGSGDLTGGLIAPFQGFFVQNTSTESSVTFTQASKTSNPTTFLGKENQIPFVRLELKGRGMQNSTWLEFSSYGSTEKTDGDAWELQPLSTHYALLATRKADDSLVDIGQYPDAEDLEIPLITEVTQPGRYTLKVTDIEAGGRTLFLNDLQTGESLRLEQGIRYEFSINQTAKVPADPFSILQDGLAKQAVGNHRFIISTTPMDPAPAGEKPNRFALEQNYPNPFNPTTAIRYQLPVTSQVRLEVFDMAGRQIATLADGQKQAGTHTINFDASTLSSGVYMYRLTALGSGGSQQIFTKKLTLIK